MELCLVKFVRISSLHFDFQDMMICSRECTVARFNRYEINPKKNEIETTAQTGFSGCGVHKIHGKSK